VKPTCRLAVAALVLVAASACDLGLGADEPVRDEGGTGEEVAEADGTPTVEPATPSPDEDGDGVDETRKPKPGFAFPRSGSYVYSQQGYEEFCTATCGSDPLPGTRSVTVTHASSARDAIVVIETARVSSRRSVRTVTRHRRSTARIAEVVDTFTTNGARYPIRYRPGPTIESLELPLRAGKAWRGTWRAATSGSYRMSVGGFDRIRTAGRSIRAARIVVRMEFRGSYEGYAVVTMWIDPTTRVAVASVGSMEIAGDLGRYTSDFDTRLERGPGY
jgi:hypothetical protein